MYEILQVKEVKDFRCLGGECKDTCCHSWEINIDKDTYKKYVNLNKSYAENLTILNSNDDYKYSKIKLNKNGFCPFFNKEKLCDIHKEYGEDMLSYTCKIYPQKIDVNMGRIEKSYSLSCPAVLDILFRSQEKLSFDLDLCDSKNIPLAGNKDNIKIEGLTNEGCFVLRSLAIEIIQDRDLCIKDRIYTLGQLCYIIQNLIDNNFSATEIFIYLNELEGNYKKEEALRNIKASNIVDENKEGLVERLLQLVKDVMLDGKVQNKINYKTKVTDVLEKDFTKLEIKEISSSKNNVANFLRENEYILEHYLVYKIFSDVFPKEYTRLDSAFEGLLSKISILLIFLRIMNAKKGSIDLEEIKNSVYFYERQVEHSTVKKLILGNIIKTLNCDWGNIIELIY